MEAIITHKAFSRDPHLVVFRILLPNIFQSFDSLPHYLPEMAGSRKRLKDSTKFCGFLQDS